MECNCNNNNSNGGVIPWVRGNRLPLIICVYENVVTQEQVGDSTLTVNEMTRVPYTIQDNDTVTVIMKSGFRQVEMPFTTDGNKVMVTDNGELPTGAYTVEVTIERGDGARGRWQETRQVRIYENTSDAQLGEMYSIDADLFFYAKGDTGTGIADITNNPDNTLTITMTDGTTYTTEALKGDKGDKGDTGERGVSIVSFDVTGQTDVSVIYTVTFSDDTTQDISVPKGPQGDTGLTGNGISSTALNSDYTLTIAYTDGTTYTTPSIRGPQGAQGVSVIGFTQTGETATNTMYNLVFSDGRTQSVAIPKGVKGDKGDTGATGATGTQGPKGDTVIIGDEQTYTLYGVTGQNSDGAMTQKAVTDALEVLGDNLIDMSTMGADTTSTTYLTVTKDVENNGVIFNVVRHNNSSPFGRIYQMHLVAGKTYRLSFEYINTAYQTAPGFRNSSNTYIHSDISYITMPINTEYKAFTYMFVAPDNVYYLAFTNLTNGAAGGSLTIRNFNLVEVNTIIEKVSELDANIEQLQEDVENIDNIKTQPLIRIPYYASQAVRTDAGHEGELINRSGCGHSNYTPLYGAKKIYVLAPALGTSNVGIAFYCREAQTSCCGVIGFVHYTGVQESLWKMYDVPEGANFFRMTLYTDIASQYQVVVPLDYLVDLSNLSLQSIIGTHIMRSAVQISEKKYIYAFGAPQYPIIGYKAYVSYGANENTVDGDMIDYPNDSCMAIVDLFDLSHEVLYPINGTKQKADGTPANNAVIGYITSCATPQGSIASFGLMRFNDKNPYYCYSIMDVESISSLEPVDGKISPVKNWTTCRLSYNGNTVDFTVNNYRQMLVDMGYASSYIASTTDAVDNINLHYDKTEGIYYAVLCGSVASSQVLPIVLMQSTDMATWSPKAYLGIKDTANEIEAIYKNGVVYVVYRTANAGMKYIVYNTSNITMLSSGIFPTSKDMLSKPDVFTFGNNVYMALNIDPSIYGELTNYNNYYLDARQEIAIYKVVNGVPKLFRRVNNPTGIDYFAFTETPPMYATQSSANPMYAQGAIYIAFSEDKRHLYRRQFAQVSFADVTALFADFGRIV